MAFIFSAMADCRPFERGINAFLAFLRVLSVFRFTHFQEAIVQSCGRHIRIAFLIEVPSVFRAERVRAFFCFRHVAVGCQRGFQMKRFNRKYCKCNKEVFYE